MNDLELRNLALDYAVRTATAGETGDTILDRARDFYQFISGKSPDHRPPPSQLKTA
jgi:hypothetical protein